MLDAFIIDKLKKEKRREKRREIQIPLYIEEPLIEEEFPVKKREEKNEEDKYYERIEIEKD